MGKAYKVIVSQRADAMLMDHVRFLAEANRDGAQRLIDEFEKAVESLQKLPERLPWLDHDLLPERKYRKMLLLGRYILVFQVKGDTVFIDHVLDGKSDYSFL